MLLERGLHTTQCPEDANMDAAERTKETLQLELEALVLARAELLAEAALDHSDVHNEWNRIDDALRFAQAEINRLGDDSAIAAQEIADAARTILAEVREGQERIRQQAARAKLRDNGGNDARR